MDDRLRETLSAMMDDQADELSVRRLLCHDDQQEVREQWQRWQKIRNLMHDDHALGNAVDVSAAVRQALAGQQRTRTDSAAGTSPPTAGGRISPWRWSAVAMVTLGLLIGFGMGSGWDSGQGGAEQDTLVMGNSVAAGVSESASPQVPEIALQGLDERQREHLSRVLLEHAQHSSVGAGRGSIGYARLSSVSDPGY